jgi:drug/metabolite transporter (DMT)-like permease
MTLAFNDISAVTFACGYAMFLGEGTATLLPPKYNDTTLGLVILSAALGWVGLMANLKGYQSVSVAAVASIASYSSVPLGYGLQVFVFGELPDVFSVAGAALIVCTNSVSAYSKWKAAQQAQAPTKEGLGKQLLSNVVDDTEQSA